MSDDEDVPQLPTDTLAILQEFYAEQNAKKDILLQLDNKESAESIKFDEDWQLSQFWYNDSTIETLVKVVRQCVSENGTVCLISCPTLFVPIKKAISDKNCIVKLFEYDTRFHVYGDDFIHYDFNNPTKVPEDMRNFFDLVIADPPFLSEECLGKTCETIKYVAKDKIVLCTGTIMKDFACKLLDLSMCEFKPEHKNNLANEFSSYSNFNLDNMVN